VRHAEYQMIVARRQQLLLTGGQPPVARIGLALRAMAITARVEKGGLMAAAVTLIAMSAERGRAAAFDGPEHLDLWPGQGVPVAIDESTARSADDVSHLPGWPLHPCPFSGDSSCLWNLRTVI
jgi:hypothetical protein